MYGVEKGLNQHENGLDTEHKAHIQHLQLLVRNLYNCELLRNGLYGGKCDQLLLLDLWMLLDYGFRLCISALI